MKPRVIWDRFVGAVGLAVFVVLYLMLLQFVGYGE
jgi:hypothetical protein